MLFRSMAEGLQRRIEYSDLKFISSFAMEKILDFQTWEEPGEHARGNFRLLLSENETGINSMNAPIQLLGQGNTAGALFSGYPEKVEIKEERGYRIADIQAVSGTILLDQKKSNRVFQKKAQTYMGIANTITADTEHSACILPGSDMQTGGTLIQYQETDWNFLKRMASQLGLPLVPDISYYYPRFYLGLPEGEKKELGEILSCDMCFDGRYYAVSGKCLVDREDFICYDVVTRTSLSLGDRVTYEGRELLVSRKKTELAGGEVIFTYRLAGNSYTWIPWEDNPDYTGMSFVGSIVGTQGEQVEVAFDIDKTAAGGNRYGFAPATGNLMYCMPQKGTKTSLYIGNGDEAQGIATGCIRTNGSICEGTGSPEKKSFRSEHGKGMDLYPQRMGLDGGETGKITFEDETGTTIESNGGLVLMAKEGIRLESMTGIAMQGMSDIMALYAEGASSLCVNGSVDMLGRRTSLAGIVYQGYDPFEDAPQKGEFDWGGFARNLAIGLGVAIACVGLALIPGIGPIVTGALIGAAIGTFCQTVYKANEEWQSGNVRSTIETVRDVVISAAAGGFTGACVVAFPVTVLFSGEIYAGVSLTGRAAWALGDSSMNNEKKMAYIFDTKQMAVDFSIGALIGIIVPGAVARKLVRDAERNMLKNTCESGSNTVYSYDGVKQASEYLQSQGVPRAYRKQILESFDVETIKLQTAGESTYGLRFYGGNANAEGRYLFETFSPLTNRQNLALPYEWNSMTGIQQFQVRNGTTMITGKAAAQKSFGSQYIGGANQWYINNLEDLIKCR